MAEARRAVVRLLNPHRSFCLIAQLAFVARGASARMGHASVTTTIDRYGQLMPNADCRLPVALDGAFSGEVVVALRPAA